MEEKDSTAPKSTRRRTVTFSNREIATLLDWPARRERMRLLQELLATGKYRVSEELLAEKMLDRARSRRVSRPRVDAGD